MPDLALLNELLERRHDFVEHALDREAAATRRTHDRVVELVEVDPFELQAPEARLDRAGDAGADLARLRGRRQAGLGPDSDVGLQRFDHAAKILFRAAVAVLRRGVEIIDAELQRAGDGALLVGRRTP